MAPPPGLLQSTQSTTFPLTICVYSVRSDLLMKLGRHAEAREELQRAIALTDNGREKQLLGEKLNRIERKERSA